MMMMHALRGCARSAWQIATQLRDIKGIVDVVLRSSERSLLGRSVEEGRLRRGCGNRTRIRTKGRSLRLNIWIRGKGILLSRAILTEALANVLKRIRRAAACATGDEIRHGHGRPNKIEMEMVVVDGQNASLNPHQKHGVR